MRKSVFGVERRQNAVPDVLAIIDALAGRGQKGDGRAGRAVRVGRDDDQEARRAHRHEGLRAMRMPLDHLQRQGQGEGGGPRHRDLHAGIGAADAGSGKIETLGGAAIDRMIGGGFVYADDIAERREGFGGQTAGR